MAASESNKKINYKLIGIGLVIFAAMVIFLDLVPDNKNVTLTAAVAVLMAFLWASEAIPLGLTSLLPLVLFPIFGVLSGKDVSNAYINDTIFLFIGGFFMAIALEKVGLHRRIALKILSILGESPFKILLGFMLAASFLSMWMSNTATTMMMLPIVFSITTSLEETHGKEKLGKYAIALLLSIAYGSSIGGIATLVGTPPNLSLIRIFEILYPDAPQIAFGQWLIFALPLTLLVLFPSLFVLYFMFPVGKGMKVLDRTFFQDKYKELGTTTIEQKRVFVLFLLLVFLWVFRKSLHIGDSTIPGWSALFPNPKFITDGTIAIFVSFLLLIIPSDGKQNQQGLINWKTLYEIPWDIVLLFGGGFALANAFISSGLSAYIGKLLASAGGLSNFGLLSLITTIITFLTELTSNTATTEMMLPIISGLSNEIRVNPLFLMIPVTLAASMAFMFPVATPPNAIVFGSGKIKIIDMIKAGIIVNFVGIISIVLVSYFWGSVIFDIVPDVFPDWAQAAVNTTP